VGNADGRPLVVTSGEPCGIGPDVCLALAGQDVGLRVVVAGDRDVMRDRAMTLGKDVVLRDFRPGSAPPGPRELDILHIPAAVQVRTGQLDPANARYVLALLDRALSGCTSGEFAAMVTAPVQKSVINDAGFPFSGHTEYLAQAAACEQVVMMLVGGGLRVALATTHLALRDVPAAITRDSLDRTLRIILADLKSRFGLASPRVAVAGLNPHAGEGGYLGREEIEVIAPVIRALREEGHRVDGPLPADTLFVPARLKEFDCALAMYHDQGLPVLKFASFGEGVNVTLGLPFIRTSVDHGTALDIAGTGHADPGSLFAAIGVALEMVRGSEAKR
jgi:4-hydroxythreonine-4-phosphate dehydrogenase